VLKYIKVDCSGLVLISEPLVGRQLCFIFSLHVCALYEYSGKSIII
jgi:hypothetical protein